MSEEVNKIIDNLCNKLGTSAQFLIPEMAKMHITELAVSAFIAGIIMAISIYFIPIAWKYDHRKDRDRFDESFWIVVPLSILFISTAFFIPALVELAGWIASPTAKAVMEIVKMVR